MKGKEQGNNSLPLPLRVLLFSKGGKNWTLGTFNNFRDVYAYCV